MANYTKYLTYDEALKKLQHYCAYQDRCHAEVRTKLISLKVYGDELEKIMTDLIDEDFLNEQRFAQSYVRGKHRIKKWGRYKIMSGLKLKKISAYCIRKGMQEIDDEEYKDILTTLLSKRLNENPSFEDIGKAVKFAITKGYESPLVWEVINSIKSQSET